MKMFKSKNKDNNKLILDLIELKFNEWAKAKDKELKDVFMRVQSELDNYKVTHTQEQKRHMQVVEEFLEIQTKLMEKYLK